MTESMQDQGTPRSYWARTGITALNLIAPGLGLLRVGSWQSALFFLAAPFVVLVLIVFALAQLSSATQGQTILALVLIVAAAAALYIAPMVRTWRQSRLRAPLRIWSRWYSILLVAVVMQLLSQPAVLVLHRFYKPFYLPAESMAPTIGKGDRLVADMRWRGPFARGAIIMFNGPTSTRISRIIALPGDRVAVRGGVPIVNGQAAAQSPQGRVTFHAYDGERSATMLIERLPGEPTTHEILDTGPWAFDNVPETIVPANRLFVMGDNRDRSADSRVPRELGGVGMVPSGAVIGRPMFITWSSDHGRIGARLGR